MLGLDLVSESQCARCWKNNRLCTDDNLLVNYTQFYRLSQNSLLLQILASFARADLRLLDYLLRGIKYVAKQVIKKKRKS